VHQDSRRDQISVQLEKDPLQRPLRKSAEPLRQLPFPDILIGEVLKLTASRDAQAKRGEEVIDPERFQDPDDERNLFAGTVYEADDEEADRIWDSVEERMDARRRARRCVKLFYQR
jgi:hypothetical protein